MPIPERDYYPLPLAASIIGCTTDDLIHWAANGKARMGVIFHVDGFNLERYHWMGADDKEKKFQEFLGFAYVDKFYFAHLERRGEFVYNAVEMLDGDSVFLLDEVVVQSIDGIFMHRNDLLSMVPNQATNGNDAPLPTSRAHVSDKLAKMNQAAAKWWANADRDERGTHPDNATVTAWLVTQGFSQTLADKAATIIRPEWAPTGRKPEE